MLILSFHQNKDFNRYKNYFFLIIIKIWSFIFKLNLTLYKILTTNIWKPKLTYSYSLHCFTFSRQLSYLLLVLMCLS